MAMTNYNIMRKAPTWWAIYSHGWVRASERDFWRCSVGCVAGGSGMTARANKTVLWESVGAGAEDMRLES